MNKIKKVLLGVISILTIGILFVTGTKVDAAEMTEECTFDNSVSNTFFTVKTATYKAKGYNGESILPSNYNSLNNTYSTVSYSNGLEMNAVINFSVDYDWTAKLLIANRETKSKTNFAIKLNGNKVWSQENVDSNEVVVVMISGEAGNNSITGVSSMTLYEMFITNDTSFNLTNNATETVTALQQEAIVGESTFVRFVFIISNAADIDSYDFKESLHLCLDDENNGPVLDRTPKVYDRITANGESYKANVKGNEYTFDNSINTNDVYVVYIVEFTTAKYLGHTIKAELEYKGIPYSTTSYVFE